MEDKKGRSPLDIALEYQNVNHNCIDAALHLMNLGYGTHGHKVQLLLGACHWGKLYVVKKLVEQHNIDPNGELVQFRIAEPIYVIAYFTVLRIVGTVGAN